MKKEVLTELEKINETKKIPEDVKHSIIRNVYRNAIIAVFIIAYFLLLLAESGIAEKAIRITGFNTFSMLLLLISIAIFEISYKRDDDILAIHGIEILVMAILTLFMPYMYFEATGRSKVIYMLTPVYVCFYYSVKMIIIAKREKRKYEISISEIKELVKKEEKKEIDLEEKRNNRKNAKEKTEESLIDKKAIEEKIPEKENIEKATTKNKTKELKEVEMKEKTVKKSTKQATKKDKKVETAKEEIEKKSKKEPKETIKKENVAKAKRGRPRKTEN